MDGDVIIIGSGIGGLIAGASLARKGKKVLVFEQHSIAGGYATSFRRKKYRFEVSLHLIGDLDNGGIINKIYKDIGILPSVEFHKVSSLYKVIFPDRHLIAKYRTDYTKTLQEMFPAEAPNIEQLFELFSNIRSDILSLNEMSHSGEFINMAIDAPFVFKYQKYTLKKLLDEYFNTDELKAIISQYWFYFGLPPSRISALFYAYVWTEYFCYGGYYPHDRSQVISNRLVELIKSNGGEVYVNSKVKQILVENKTAVGIKLHNNKTYYSDSIISNANILTTFRDLVGYEHLKNRYIKKIENIEPSISCIQVYLCLDINISDMYGESNHEIFVNESYDMEKAYRDIVEDRIDDAPFGITIYENIIKGYNMQGKTTLSLIQLSNYDNWSNLVQNEYIQKKEWALSCLLERLDRVFPNITQHIVFKNISTPITNERYTGNIRGAMYGAALTVQQTLSNRVSQVTPICNLLLAGAWTRPSSGYSGCTWSGYNAAQIILGGKDK